MAENTSIEWADHTFNPWIGCQVASPDGCKNCYAERLVKRFGDDFAQRRRTSEANWKLPLKWNAQAAREGRRFRVFCASLADVFDNQVPEPWRWDLFRLIAATPHLDWLLLTKRIGNAREMLNSAAAAVAGEFVGATEWDRHQWPNVWLGATVVNQAEADRDIPKLLATPARVRFLSIEPMLGPIDLTRIELHKGPIKLLPDAPAEWRGMREVAVVMNALKGSKQLGMAPLSWVICGGESGPGARPMHPDWARSLRDQCAAAGVSFLFKQWGEWAPAESVGDDDDRKLAERWIRLDGTEPPAGQGVDFFRGDEVLYWVGKKAAGRQLDGRTHDEFPA